MSRAPGAALRREVVERALGSCEYCGLPDGMDLVPHEVDHIIAVKHGGETTADHLAFACYLCNKHKGTDLASVDPESGGVTLLFHPRRDVWTEHFAIVVRLGILLVKCYERTLPTSRSEPTVSPLPLPHPAPLGG